MMFMVLVALMGADAGVAAAAVDAAPPPADAGPPKAKGPPPAVQMKCTPEAPRIGEDLVCTVEILHPKDVSVSVQPPEDARLDDAAQAKPAPDGVKLITERTFRIQVLDMKGVKVSGVSVTYQEQSGGVGSVPVKAERVNLKSVIGGQKEPKFRTFKEPVPEGGDEAAAPAFWSAHGPMPWRVPNWPLIIFCIVIGVLIVGIGGGMLVKRWLDGREVVEVEWVDPRPAHVIALEALEKLAAEALPEKGEAKAYYFRISEIVRAYLERRYGFGALEMTDDEIREIMRSQDMEREARSGVAEFLTECEMVKFAGFSPSREAVDSIMRMARGVIELTRVVSSSDSTSGEASA